MRRAPFTHALAGHGGTIVFRCYTGTPTRAARHGGEARRGAEARRRAGHRQRQVGRAYVALPDLAPSLSSSRAASLSRLCSGFFSGVSFPHDADQHNAEQSSRKARVLARRLPDPRPCCIVGLGRKDTVWVVARLSHFALSKIKGRRLLIGVVDASWVESWMPAELLTNGG